MPALVRIGANQTTVRLIQGGLPGPAGQGVPAGGATGQALVKIDGTDYNTQWQTLSGTGDVAGPASSVDSEVALFNGTTGKVIKSAVGTGIAKLASGVLSVVARLASLAELPQIATARILGRTTAGSGDVEELTAAAARTLLNVEDGATADQTGGELATNIDIENLTARSAFESGDKLIIWESGVGNRQIDYDDLPSGGGGGISNVVEDTTPQLGGALDVNGQEIQSIGGTDIVLHSDNDVDVILGDASGADDFTIFDSGAVQVFNVDSDGNLTLSGTADGRDLAADGTKLDGIESGATADQTGAEIAASIDIENTTPRTAFASGDKLIIWEAGVGNRQIDYADLPGAGGGLSNIVEDTTPQLGGALDVNGQEIVSISGTDVVIHSDNNAIITLGDAVGGDVFRVRDNANATKFEVTSAGQLNVREPGISGVASQDLLFFSFQNFLFGLDTNDGSSKFHILDQDSSEIFAVDSDGVLTLAGTVDGRDVATDGTKLDGIEAGADVTDAANVAAAGAVMDGDFTADDRLLKRSGGAGSYANVTITAAGEALIDDADASVQRTTLGLGNAATATIGTGSTNVAPGDITLRKGTATATTTTTAVDLSNVDWFEVTLQTATTALNISNAVDGKIYRIRITQDSTGGREATAGTGFNVGSDVSLDSFAGDAADEWAWIAVAGRSDGGVDLLTQAVRGFS